MKAHAATGAPDWRWFYNGLIDSVLVLSWRERLKVVTVWIVLGLMSDAMRAGVRALF